MRERAGFRPRPPARELPRGWHQPPALRVVGSPAGPFTDGSGAMGVFTSRAAAEEFAASDPFVLHDVVGTWRVTEWAEAIVSS